MASWPTSTPQEQRFDPALFASALASLPSPAIVVRNGYIVGTKGSVSTPDFIWSASKSLVACICARQIQLGNIGYDDIVPGSNLPSNPSANFRQFLSMTSDYNLSSPSHAPGEHYGYNNGAVHHYGGYLRDTFYAGNTDVQFLQNGLANSLGFEDGIAFAGFLSGWDGGWSVSARDLCRPAQLILNNGVWEGTQLIPATFCESLFTCQIKNTLTPSTGSDEFYNQSGVTPELPRSYSYGFWLPQNCTVFTSKSEAEAASMSGAFGTSCHISRDFNMIVCGVHTVGTHSGGKITGAMLDALRAAIIPTASKKIPI